MQSRGKVSAIDLLSPDTILGCVSIHRSLNAGKLAARVYVLYFAAIAELWLGRVINTPQLAEDRRARAIVLACCFISRRMVGNRVDRDRMDIRARFGAATSGN